MQKELTGAIQPLHPADSTAADGDFLNLPLVLVQDILARCDVRSSASAARTCGLMLQAHSLNSYFHLTRPFQVFMDAIEQINVSSEEEGDGSCESGFVIQVPLDGSVLCGSDLKEALSNNSLLKNLTIPSMAAFLGLVSGPGGGGRMDDALKVLKAKIASSKM